MHRFGRGFAPICVLVAALQLSASAATGTVTEALKVRSGPGTDTAVVGMLYSGDTVDIKGQEGNWYIIGFEGNDRYVYGDYVSTSSSGGAVIRRGVVSTDVLNIRAQASTSGEILGKLVRGDVIYVAGVENGWYTFDLHGQKAYVSADYITLEGSAAARGTDRGRETQTTGQKIVEEAKKYLGVPYVSGGRSPKGFDCSGFTYYVFKQLGIELPHSSAAQAGYGQKVDKASLQPGDLVFFNYYGSKEIDHVGIYVGNGQFIHSTVPGSTVRYSSMNSSYYVSNYVTARRVK